MRIGRVIVDRQVDEGYASLPIERLFADLTASVPRTTGILPLRNLRYMRTFAAAWPAEEIEQNVLHNRGWGQIELLLDRLGDTDTRFWCAHRALADGWTHGIMSDGRTVSIPDEPFDDQTESRAPRTLGRT